MKYENENECIFLDEPVKFYGKIESIEIVNNEKRLVHFYALDEIILNEIEKNKNVQSQIEFILSDNYRVSSFYFEINQANQEKLSYDRSYLFFQSKKIAKGKEIQSILYALDELPNVESNVVQASYILEPIHGNNKKAKLLNSVSCFSKIEDQLNILTENDDIVHKMKIRTDWDVSFLCVKNVGQGSTNIFLDKKLTPSFYVDIGFQNKDFEFQHKNSKDCPIFLTHWDNDHYKLLDYFANRKKEKLENIIIAPYQLNVGLLAVKTLLQLKEKKTDIFLIKTKENKEINLGTLKIVKSSSTRRNQDKNEKSFYYFIEVHESRVLLAGDCRYKFIQDRYKEKLDALVVYHHGADYPEDDDTPFARGIKGKAYFSAGNNQKYGHPTDFSKSEHCKKNWSDSITGSCPGCNKCGKKFSFLYCFQSKNSSLYSCSCI